VSDHGRPSLRPLRGDHPTALNNLRLRLVSALVLAPLAIGAAYLAGLAFIGCWAAAALAILWEWRRITGETNPITLAIGVAAVLFAAVQLTMANGPLTPFNLVVIGAIVITACCIAGAVAEKSRAWTAGGIFYASILLIAPSLLRADRELGFAAILFLFAVVWATDIFGYFVGRFVGGAKLCPALSPNKTWSGALGGAVGAVISGFSVTTYFAPSNSLAIIGLALLLSAISQAGDLFESAVKRRFGAKDAGVVIPGHGGVMDRLDGFLMAALAAAVIGLARGGLDAPARGLLVW
jgi:phosphatidate cytidylyltransferase